MNKHRLLVIDDDPNMRHLLEIELSDMGYEVQGAESAINGLSLLQRQNFDLVVLDIKMPGMDGIEALGKIIGTQRILPVVIHSAYSHYKENYLTWSAAAYVVKSGDFTELKETVKNLLANSGSKTEQIQTD